MNSKLTNWLIFLVLLSPVSVVLAADKSLSEDLNQPLTLANELMGKRLYQQAYLETHKYAENNELAQFNLGLMELYGWGRDIDQQAACEWFEKSAAKNIPMAQEFLGDCYRDGMHRPPNFELAKKWYLQAVNNGLPTANCKLGQVYIEGKIVEQNWRKGVRLCEQAAENNAIHAQLYLARNFDHGGEFDTDLERALFWYSAAASSNNPDALYRIAELIESGEVSADEPHKAVEFSEAAANRGNRNAYILTARLYYQMPLDPDTSLPTPVNLAKAYMWTQASLRQVDNDADRAEAQKMLKQIRRVMPETWERDLDGEVDDHFERLAATGVVSE